MRLQSSSGGMGVGGANQTRPAPARPRLARGSSGHHVAAPPLTTTPIKLILRRNYYLRSAALVSNGGSEQLFGMVYWYGNGCGGVAGVGGDQPGAGSGGALALLHAQEAARERARLPAPADGRRRWWCWLAAARPRAANPVVPVDRRGVLAL